MSKYRFFFSLSFLFISIIVGAQSLTDQLDSIVSKSSNYQQYKVIKQTEINAFSKNLSNELEARAIEINSLQEKLSTSQSSIDDLKSQIIDLQNQIGEIREVADQISFLGIAMNKSSYHILVWVIIVVLAVLAVFSYMLFMRSNKVTQTSKKDLHVLNREFDQFKDKSRETQVKLKRELQTAVNTIEELKKSGMRR